MYAFIFRNKLAALLFVGVILFGVVSLVGTEDRDGLLQKGVDSFEGEKAAFGEKVDQLGGDDDNPFGDNPGPAPEPVFGESEPDASAFFDDDSELIDDAAGFDPTPDIGDFSPDNEGEIIGTLAPEPPEPALRPDRRPIQGARPDNQPDNGLISPQEAGRLEERLADGQ